MGPDSVVAGSTDVSVVIRIMDSTTGLPETAVEHNTSGIDLWYRREGAVSTDITEAALAALTTAHTDGGIEHINDGYYRLDVPDAAFAAGADGVQIGGTVTGMVVYGPYIKLADPVNNLFESFVIGATGNSTTALHLSTLTGYGDDELIDELLWVYDNSAGEWHPAWITDWVLSTLVATVVSARGGGALPFTPEASVDRVWRSGVTRSNILNTAALNSVNAEVDTAIADAGLDHLGAVVIDGVAETGTLSTTQATSNLTGYADTELRGRTITFTSGTANGQQARITAYTSTNGLLTFTAIATAPANLDAFTIT